MSVNPTVVFRKPGNVVIEEREIPDPRAGELLLENIFSMMSTGTEITILSGEYPSGSAWSRIGNYPYTPGYNGVAKVVKAGDTGNLTWVGKTVVGHSPHCRYSVQSVEMIQQVPDDVLLEEACFYTLAPIALNAIRRADVHLGEAVVIYGMGVIGHLTALFCRLCGASPVIAVDTSSYRLDLLPEDSLLFGINPLKSDVRKAVEEWTCGRMADVVVEASGVASLIPTELEVMKDQGRFVIVSSPREKIQFDFHDMCCWPSFTLIGAHSSSHPQTETLHTPWSKKRHGELLFSLLVAKQLDLKHMITHYVSYRDAPTMYHKLLSKSYDYLGILICWDEIKT
ncbi:MAG: zinc-binding alcohol dehydrogenase [Spirochaetaceae bacterium]|nr:MAG: zinc-binding alcohol dehydrogenase [Spirochaetaceae bacterium]